MCFFVVFYSWRFVTGDFSWFCFLWISSLLACFMVGVLFCLVRLVCLLFSGGHLIYVNSVVMFAFLFVGNDVFICL